MNLQNKFRKLAETHTSTDKSDWKEIAAKHKANAKNRKRSRNIALRVLQALADQGLSQADLAAKMGVSRQYVSSIAKGNYNFTIETIGNLEDALGIELMVVHEPGYEEKQKDKYITFHSGDITSYFKAVMHDPKVAIYVSITDKVIQEIKKEVASQSKSVPLDLPCQRARREYSAERVSGLKDACVNLAKYGYISYTTQTGDATEFMKGQELQNREAILS